MSKRAPRSSLKGEGHGRKHPESVFGARYFFEIKICIFSFKKVRKNTDNVEVACVQNLDAKFILIYATQK